MNQTMFLCFTCSEELQLLGHHKVLGSSLAFLQVCKVSFLNRPKHKHTRSHLTGDYKRLLSRLANSVCDL